MQKIDLLPCPFCGGKAEIFPLDKYDSYGNHERLWYSECGECFARSGYYNTEGEAAIAWNTRASGWIPCSDRMPEDNVDVLVYDDGILIARYNADEKYTSGWMEPFGYPLTNVTHWTHIPAPPEVKSNVD